jgi:hypothetical protein
MYIKASITLEYHEKKQAEIAFKSLNPDNLGYVETELEDHRIICNLEGNSIRTVLATADDLLFSEMTVEKIEKLSQDYLKNPPSREE